MKNINWYYRIREERSKWISERFKESFESSNNLLDVGCYNKDLKKHVSNEINYLGIDVTGSPDMIINLEEIERLPFENNSFNIVVCADVLEHLENIHLIFDELCRVSNKYIIITLPNPIFGMNRYILRKRYANDPESEKQFGKYLKYYGLPLEKPLDRHKWFFSYEDAINFITYRSNKCGFEVKVAENNLIYEKFKFPKNILINLIKHVNKNFAVRDAIFLLEKNCT